MMRFWRWPVLALVVGAAIVLVLQPPAVRRVEHWTRYRLTGYLPPPLVAGRNGRLFLGNHQGSPPQSLITDLCGTGNDKATIAHATAMLRPIVEAGEAVGVPFRLLIVPTAPRLYPEDVPAAVPCTAWPADQVAQALNSPALIYPVAAMEALKAKFDVLPRQHFHWAGEGPLRVAELVADDMGLHRTLQLALRPDNRSSDLNGFYPGLGLHDRIGTPNLMAAGVTQCWGARCDPALPEAIVAFARPGPGRVIVIADSFGDEIGGDFSEYAGSVWLVRMNIALITPLEVEAVVRHFQADAVVVVYHDAGALALDSTSQASLALTARLLNDASLQSSHAGN